MAAKTGGIVLDFPPIQQDTLIVSVIGDTPLICHAWGAKAKKQMADAQQGKARQKKAPKDPKAEYEDCFYRLPKPKASSPDMYGFPSIAFKKAICTCATLMEGMYQTTLRRIIGVWAPNGSPGEIEGLVPLEYEDITMGEDAVRLNGRTADLRYRPYFHGWRTILKVTYLANMITAEQVATLINLAGFAIGVGENRPEKGGDFGKFHMAVSEEV